MKKADYFIKKVFEEIKTFEDAKATQKEVREWIKTAGPSEVSRFRDSGAGEMLYMLCR